MATRCFSCAWTRVDGSDEEDGRFYDCEEEFREEKEEEEDGDEDGDDARETLTRVGAAMEYESRGGSYVSRVRAHARALAAMASIVRNLFWLSVSHSLLSVSATRTAHLPAGREQRQTPKDHIIKTTDISRSLGAEKKQLHYGRL